MELLPLELSFPCFALKRPVFTGHHKSDESPGQGCMISSLATIGHCASRIAIQTFPGGDKQALCRGSQGWKGAAWSISSVFPLLSV